ncbi:MAG: hypothetical protein MPJ24_07400 [Pirellulaceae bacterium]|nr:hypothetical protein [Pirellulaceae bacterium]
MVNQTDHQRHSEDEFEKQAANLLSQQIWCWGRDILRPEGNWLLETGFERIAASADREDCPSMYTLELPKKRRVVLRGFGVFYEDDAIGGVFLPRYEFQPKYTEHGTLKCPPWSATDLSNWSPPKESQQNVCASLTIDLLDWIQGYETTIVERLGLAYRQSSLLSWDTGKRPVTPAEEMVPAWRSLGVAIAENFQMLNSRPPMPDTPPTIRGVDPRQKCSDDAKERAPEE